jgi:hypothetical protein
VLPVSSEERIGTRCTLAADADGTADVDVDGTADADADGTAVVDDACVTCAARSLSNGF